MNKIRVVVVTLKNGDRKRYENAEAYLGGGSNSLVITPANNVHHIVSDWKELIATGEWIHVREERVTKP